MSATPTRSSTLLIDALGRVRESVGEVVADLAADGLGWRVDRDANPIGWLVWHLTRVTDDHVAELAGTEQRWTAAGWMDRFGLPYPRDTVGYGQSSAEVGAFDIGDPALLTGYHDDVHDVTVAYLEQLPESELDRVVDRRWDPPVTLGVRLVSVVNDATQHVGQAAYVRGLLHRR